MNHLKPIDNKDHAYRIEMKYLLKHGYLQEGMVTERTLRWGDESTITLISNLKTEPFFINLIYTLVEMATNTKTGYDYKVVIEPVESKKQNYCFICPQIGNKVLILYRTYGSPRWKSRTAYNAEIENQLLNPNEAIEIESLTKYYQVSDKIEHLYSKLFKTSNEGKIVKLQQKINSLKIEKEFYAKQAGADYTQELK